MRLPCASAADLGVDQFHQVAAQADGRLKPMPPEFAAQQVQGLLKSFAFWPQISLNQPPLSAEMQSTVIESALDMFLACYQC